ncbi:MAG: hypothetical protein IJ258_05185 [Methanobrevibacter sp.]|uniref:hypothetical protein n=1 Tax=Methanobrevibacter sp. TaxID=66852 RepID=UPI0025FC9E72|nr:hypothetical protein [Methanobrevibacter sp.]MBQ8017483.1 hypothetical protein [Methanobrevibacter sp.]
MTEKKDLQQEPIVVEVDQKKMIVIPEYEISESAREMGISKSIFNLSLDDLVYEKMFLMFEKISPLEKTLFNTKQDLKNKKDELLRTIDFKKELNITTKPTIADKDAVMKPHLQEFEDKINTANEDIKKYKDKLVIINDLIDNKRVQLKVEGGLLE